MRDSQEKIKSIGNGVGYMTNQIKDVSDYLLTHTIDSLLNIVHNTKEYIPAGAVTREEFNSFRGVNLYLWQQLRQIKPKRQPKWD